MGSFQNLRALIMVTEIQRVQAICDGLINQTATASQITRLGTALATQSDKLAEYQSGTNTQKARIFLDCLRDFCSNTIKATRAASAAQAAADSEASNPDNTLPEAP